MKQSFDELLDAMRKNLKYCGWAKEQTFDSYVKQVFDEADELKEAVEKGDYEHIKEELGDLLWDVLVLALIAEKQGIFLAKDVIKSRVEKTRRRKPEIFEGKHISKEEALKNWDKAKKEEKNGK